MDFQNIYILSIILCFHVCNVMLSPRETIRLQIKMKLKPSEPVPSKMKILFKNNGFFENLWLTRNTGLDMNAPLYVIRNDYKGEPKLINIAQDDNRKSALYHNILKETAFLLKGKENKPENFHVTGIIRMNKGMFELKKSNESRAGKSVKKRKMGTNVFLEITDFYAIELIHFNELKNNFFRIPDFKLNENLKIKRVKREVPGQLSDFSYDMVLLLDYREYLRRMEWVDPECVLSNISRKTEAKLFLREFYLLTINCLNLMFLHMEHFSFRLQIYLQSIIILDVPEDSKFITEIPSYKNDFSVNVYLLLDSFQEWIAKIPITYDHAMLITDTDLFAIVNEKYITSVTGISYVGALCTNFSLSIVESNFGFSVTQVMMHEIAHSLGSRHDGNNNNCSKESSYIMSHARNLQPNSTHPWSFSSCSIKEIEKNLNNIIDHGNCIQRTSTQQGNNDTTLLPGQVYTVDKQCQLAFGRKSYFYRHQNYTQDICKVIFCLKPEIGLKYIPLVPLPSAPGTLCAPQKWCEQGACVYSSKAPNTSIPCLYGDEPRLFGKHNCLHMVQMVPQLCGMQDFQETCSCSCSKYKVNDSCCPYGPEFVRCHKQLCENYAGFCCETCPNLAANCSCHSRKKRSSHFNAAMQKKATLFLKSYINLVTMKQNQVVDNNALEERKIDLAKCPLMNGDLYEYCNKLVFAKSNSACYDELISQICCQACILVTDKKSPGCKYGDRNEETCSQWAKEGQLANQCINNEQVREHICCQSCQLLAPTMFSGSKRYLMNFPCIMIVLYVLLFDLRSIF